MPMGPRISYKISIRLDKCKFITCNLLLIYYLPGRKRMNYYKQINNLYKPTIEGVEKERVPDD